MSVEYIELNMANYDEDQVSQLNAWGIWASHEIERLQKERSERISRDCTMDEVDELMDCIHSDHTFEDLDQHTPADMQTTTGSTIAWLMHRCHQAETIMQRLKDATNPLMEVSERELHRTRVAAENHFRDVTKMVEKTNG
jgi:hypothetical protein